MHTSLKKSHFCAQKLWFFIFVPSPVFEASVHFKVGRSSSIRYVKWKNTMTGNVNFLTQNVGSETSLLFKMWILTEKSHFCALSVMFLRLVCILKLEGLLQCYVKWKNTMTGNVNFLTQNVGSETSLLNFKMIKKHGYWPKNQTGFIFVPNDSVMFLRPLHF